MKRRGYLIYGVLVYLFFLVASMPASLVMPLLLKSAPGGPARRLQVSGLAGPWWKGSADWASLAGVTVSDVRWRFAPLALLTGRLGARLNFAVNGGNFDGGLGVGFGGVSLRKVKLRMPLAQATRAAAVFGFILDGQAELNLKNMTMRQGVVTTASGELELSEVSLRAPRQVSLGDFKAKITTEPEGVQMAINDAGGALRTQLLLRLTPEGGYNLSGTLAAADQEEQALADLLGMLGRKGAGGQVSINRAGKLPLPGK